MIGLDLQRKPKLTPNMRDQLFDFYFNDINSRLYAGVSIIGIYAGLIIRHRT